MSRVAFAILLALAMNGWPLVGLAAADGSWVLVKSSGDVRVQTAPGRWTRVSTSNSLQPGDTIWTGPRGRALLRHATGVLTLAPQSMVRIPDHDFGPKRTIMLQYEGQVSADIEKGPSGHFSIRTPYLAAVVKGTKFSVTIGAESTIVAVEEGVVMVQDLDTAQATTVRAGRAVATRHRPNEGLSSLFDAANATPESLRAAIETEQSGGLQSPSGAATGSALGGTVSGVGNAVGGTVSSLGNAAGNAVSGVGNAAGGTVGSVGNAAGNTVSSVGSAAGDAVSGVGDTVGGIAGGLGIGF